VLPMVGSLAMVLAVQVSAPVQDARPADPVRATVTQTIRWLERQAVAVPESGGGVLFRDSSETRGQPQPQIYGGSAGVLIFLENAAAVLDDARARALADATMKGLLATRRNTASGAVTWMPAGMKEGAVGLYTGDAGVGAAFLVRGRLRKDAAALQAAAEVGDAIVARGITKGDQLSWDQQVEVIYGASGTILFLLDLADETKEESYLNSALAAARWLIAKAEAEPSQRDAKQRLLHWRWQLAGDSPYVNFSHGTAGVAYALARVGAAAPDEACAQASRDAAAWLMEQGTATGDLFCFPVIAGEKTTMGGWCHGPPGTARLFLLLNEQTGDPRYLEVALASARWVMAQAPAPAEGGAMAATFPPSFCCGVAGVLDFFCDLYRVTGKREFADFARRAGDYLIQTAAPEDAGKESDGVRWARGANSHGAGREEHPVDLMQGAAGEGLALLRLATLDMKVDPVRHLPDRAVRSR
jgi:lantibiotic modifying enzyme